MVKFPISVRRRYLVAALLVIVVGLISLYYFGHNERVQNCAAKGLEIFPLGNVEICRDRDTGLLYAP